MSTFEARTYEMPLGLVFRRGVLWHEGCKYVFSGSAMRELQRDPNQLIWNLLCLNAKLGEVRVEVRGREGLIHRLGYVKTDCSGQFEVANDSLAAGKMTLRLLGKAAEELTTESGAVLEMVGNYA